MVQAVVNNLNNIQDVLALNEAKLQSANKPAEPVSKEDFNKIFDDKKQVALDSEQTENKSQLSKEKSTITDLKTKHSIENDDIVSVELKDAITKALNDSKVENSLDLTLSKDIAEIISQLKEFIESTAEDGEIIIDESMLDKLSEFVSGDDIQNLLSEIKKSSEDEDVKTLFAQIAEILNTKTVQNSDMKEDVKFAKEQIASIFKSTTEPLNVLETVSEPIAEKFVKTQEEVIAEESEPILDEDVLKDLNIESIESEMSSSNGESLMQNQTPEEQGLKAMLNQEVEAFDLKIDKTAPTSNVQNAQSTQNAQSKSLDINPSKILDQVAKQLEGLQSNSKVNIVLNPESLGRVTVQLIKTGEGLSAQFTVASQEVRDMLMKGLDGLKETLLSQGVGVDNVSVKLSEAQKSEYNADWTEQEGSNGRNKGQDRSNREEKEKGLFEKMMAQTIQDENGNV